MRRTSAAPRSNNANTNGRYNFHPLVSSRPTPAAPPGSGNVNSAKSSSTRSPNMTVSTLVKILVMTVVIMYVSWIILCFMHLNNNSNKEGGGADINAKKGLHGKAVVVEHDKYSKNDVHKNDNKKHQHHFSRLVDHQVEGEKWEQKQRRGWDNHPVVVTTSQGQQRHEDESPSSGKAMVGKKLSPMNGNDFVATGKSDKGRTSHHDDSSPKSGKVSITSDVTSSHEAHRPSIAVLVDENKFHFDRQKAEQTLSILQRKGNVGSPSRSTALHKVLTAYVEPPMDDTIPHTGNQGDPENPRDVGEPPQFVVPLPLRRTTPQSLRKFTYPQVQTCYDMPSKLPIDHGLQLDSNGKHLIPNTFNKKGVKDPIAEAKYCPVDADPFLPWVHDVFPSADGKVIHFVAQNKRRCNTGKDFLKDLKRLEPQVALMQPVSVKRIDEEEAREIAPELWHPDTEDDEEEAEGGGQKGLPRYRLAPYEESDPDGQFTRFICRFHTMDFATFSLENSDDGHQPQTIILGETLSTYPFNYELVAWKKSVGTMITPKGKDNQQFWLSNLRFDCPLPPENEELGRIVSSGESVLSDGTPTIYVDLVPIRTSPRYGTKEVYFTEDIAGPRMTWGNSEMRKMWWNEGDLLGFDPKDRWGDRNVMPRVEASGRWANIPICWPPRPDGIIPQGDKSETGRDHKDSPIELVSDSVERKMDAGNVDPVKKPYTLTACLWASSSFHTRGHVRAVSDTIARLEEWLEFHLLVGFDHIYVYDNSGAHTNETSLASTLAKFPPEQVTRIEWPSRVCNNNVPAHENTGERSSQYAAESSCRQRFGPFTEWLASFDTDEYLIPMGKYDSLKEVVRDAAKKGTHILSFKSTRALINQQYTEPYYDGGECGEEEIPLCIARGSDSTFLETYNCDRNSLPKPEWAQRAKKQVYQPDYVLHHHVHYSTVTKRIAQTYKEAGKMAKLWSRHYTEKPPSERFTNELEEAVMLHTKTTVPGDTKLWMKRCHHAFNGTWKEKCRVGFPWPDGIEKEGGYNDAGYKYNCFSIDKVTEYWIPRLREAMEKRGTRKKQR